MLSLRFALVQALALSVAVSALSTFYVSPSGSDSNPGTEASPFKTLVRARDAIRASRDPVTGALQEGGAIVNLGPGTYSMSPESADQTMLELDPALDSGDGPDSFIAWQSTDPNNPARLVGGPVTTMSKLAPCGGSTPLSTEELADLEARGVGEGASSRLTRAGWRLPAGAMCLDLLNACGGNSTAAKSVAGTLGPNTLGQCNWNRGEVVWGGKPLTLARWPNTFQASPPSPPPVSTPHEAEHMEQVRARLQTAGLSTSGLDLAASGSPAAAPAYPESVTLFNWSHIDKATATGFSADTTRPLQWAKECNGAGSDCWVHGYWTYGWADSYVRISSITASGSTGSNIETDAKTPPVYGFKDKARWYGVSLLSELDVAGEYYVDASALKVYILPPAGASPSDEVVVTGSPFLITSTATSEALARHEAAGTEALVASRNFADDDYSTARSRWETHGRAAGMLAAQKAEKAASGAVGGASGLSYVAFGNFTMVAGRNGLSFSDTQSVVVHNIEARAMTKSAVSIHGNTSFVVNVDGSDCGCSPVHVGGGSEDDLTPSGTTAFNITAMEYSRLIRTYNPGLSWTGVGTIYAYNTFAFAPHQGWLGGGNDNVFVSSTVNLLCFEVSDSGAWYSGRSWAHRNNTLAGNLFGNIVNLETPVLGSLSIQAVYNDDQLSNNMFVNNIFYNNHKAMFIGGGRRHSVYNNSFYSAGVAVHIDDRGLTWQKSYCTPPNGTFIQELEALNYQSPPWSEHYPELVNITKEYPCVPVFNNVLANCQSGPGNFTDVSSHDAASWKENIQTTVPACKPLPMPRA